MAFIIKKLKKVLTLKELKHIKTYKDKNIKK